MTSQCPALQLLIVRYLLFFKDLKLVKEIERIVSVEGKAYELYPQITSIEKPLREGSQEAVILVKRIPKEPLLTQADLIRLMKEKHIRRSSTYSFLINRLFERGYIFEKNFRLIPTKKGQKVAEYLLWEFPEFLSEQHSRLLEELIDRDRKRRKKLSRCA